LSIENEFLSALKYVLSTNHSYRQICIVNREIYAVRHPSGDELKYGDLNSAKENIDLRSVS
jgi:hypothetical protein